MADIITIIVTLMIYSGLVVLFFGIFTMFLAIFNKFKYRRYKLDPDYKPWVTFLTPAYNEGQFIEETIKHFLKTSYPVDQKRMVIVNDGSTDDTEKKVRKYATHIVNSETGRKVRGKKRVTKNYPEIVLVNKTSGGKGKAYALNVGMPYCKGDLVLITDGDIQIQEDIFEQGVKHFADPDVGALVGYASIIKKGLSPLEGFIDFEFFSTQQINRRGLNVMGVHFIIPGGMSFFRIGLIEAMGGYPPDTLAEDTDLSFNVLMKSKKKIHYDTKVRVISSEPLRLRDLWNQRVRWARGNVQVTWKHKDKVGNPKYGTAATIFYPFWLAYIILPIAFLVATGGIMLDLVLGLGIIVNPIVKDIILLSFFGSWFFAAIMARGRSALEGLLGPGLPVFIAFFSFLFFDGGIVSLIVYLGFPTLAYIVGLMLGFWILIAIPGSYLSVHVSDKHERIGTALQLGIFGYWNFLITCVIHGYGKEMKGHENIWIKTKKDLE